MIYTVSKGTIYAEADAVYSVLKNIAIWPDIFPPCQKTRIISSYKDSEIVEITSLTNGKTSSWRSQRVFRDDERKVFFRQLKTAKPLSLMQGIWIVVPHDNCTEVILKHRFNIKPFILHVLIGRIVKKYFVDANSDNEIAGLKRYCEEAEMYEIST